MAKENKQYEGARHDVRRDSLPTVVVVGGGFAGAQVVRGLRRSPVRVILIDRHNYHLFQPLLYQVATAVLSPADIAQPIRRMFRKQANAEVLLGEVRDFDLALDIVKYDSGQINYDYLVLAAGATHSYFGHDDWREEAPGLKTIDDALEMRRRILLAFEEAEQENDEASRRSKLTFVVVGGGPTGVELVGALKEIAAKSIPRDFRRIDTTTTRVILIEAGDRVLKAFPEALSRKAGKTLEAMGVELRFGQRVTQINEVGVMIGDESVPAENVFWAAGVKASPLAAKLGVATDQAGRVIVERDLSVPDRPNVFVVGDLAAVKNVKTDSPVPGVAPAAMQMGRFVARAIDRDVNARLGALPRGTFEYVDKGSMATIGKAKAVAAIGGAQFSGLIAWLLWSVIHILFLVSFRAKVFVVMSWVWSYVVNSKGARLITGNPKVNLTTSVHAAEVAQEDK